MVRSLRVMTSNVLKGRADAAAFSRLLDEVSPDVLVLQELSRELATLVADRFRNHSLHPSEDSIGRGIATNTAAEFGVIEMPLQESRRPLARRDRRHERGEHVGLATRLAEDAQDRPHLHRRTRRRRRLRA